MDIKGRVWKYGNDVDTDVIIPARYLNNADPKALAEHCMEDLDASFAANVKQGDIMVAGKNFGCGSSREHAPIAIKVAGITAIVAKSFARIFYRNAINIGLPILESAEAAEAIANGDIVEIDVENGTINDITSGKTFQAKPFPPFMRELMHKGGLINYVKEKIWHEL